MPRGAWRLFPSQAAEDTFPEPKEWLVRSLDDDDQDSPMILSNSPPITAVRSASVGVWAFLKKSPFEALGKRSCHFSKFSSVVAKQHASAPFPLPSAPAVFVSLSLSLITLHPHTGTALLPA